MDLRDYNMLSILEAILFACPEPVSIDKLCAFTENEKENIEEALHKLNEKYEKEDSGLMLINKGGNYTISTKLILGEVVARFLQSRKSPYLSQAALEALAIAAYNQPVTKTYISQIRGVSSSEIVESLVEKNLLKEDGKMDLPGRPMSYVTTDKFLTIFGLNSLDELPPPETLLPLKVEEEAV